MKHLSKVSRSLSARLSLYIILIVAILFCSCFLFVAVQSKKYIKKEAEDNANLLLNSTILKIEKVLEEVQVATNNMAWIVQEHISDSAYMYNITRQLVACNKTITGSAIAFEPNYYSGVHYYSPFSFKEKGDIKSIQLGNENYDYHYYDWYQIPKLLKHSYWAEPYFDEGGNNQIISTYSVPLLDKNGNVFAILTADVALVWLTDELNSIKPYKNSYNFMIGKGGTYISNPDTSKILNETVFITAWNMKDSANIIKAGLNMKNGKTGKLEFTNNNGDRSFAVYTPLENGWSLGIVCPYKDVFANVNKINIIFIIVAICGLLLLFFACKYFIKSQVRPLEDFDYSAQEIAKGNFHAVLPNIKTNDEMRHLRDSFESMQHSLDNYIEDLKQTTAAKERMESELNVARSIQMGMIPKIFPPFPERNDIELYAIMKPAKEVGGDLYDYFINDEKLIFIIGDVSGKGIPASLVMSITVSLFRYIARQTRDTANIVSSISTLLSEKNDTCMFVTTFVGILELKTGKLTFCNGGHNAPIVISPDGKSVNFMTVNSNIAAGLIPNYKFKHEEITFEKGTTLLFYTDGLTEAENKDKKLYGEQHLLNELKAIGNQKPQILIEKIIESVHQHVQDEQQSDDLTMMSIRVDKN